MNRGISGVTEINGYTVLRIFNKVETAVKMDILQQHLAVVIKFSPK